MSNPIDKMSVQLEFDNQKFAEGVKSTEDDLGRLNSALQMPGADEGAGKVTASLDKMSALSLVAFNKAADAAVNFGQKTLSALVDPIVEGGKKRALNIEQARFQLEGLNLDVETIMDNANEAVKGTAFGLDEAAVAASQFGASGIQAGEEMATSLRGISGVAAMAGSSYSDVADIFTKVAGQGRLMGEDLNRLGSRGINAAATLGKAMGKTETEIRDMVSKGQISFKDFSKAMSDAFGEHATRASETYTGAMSNMNAAFARIGAEIATAKHEKLRRIFVALTPVIDSVKDALGPMFELYSENADASATMWENILGNIDLSSLQTTMQNVADIIRNLRAAFSSFLEPIKAAFSEVFGDITGSGIVSGLENFSAMLVRVTDTLKLSSGAASGVQKVFEGIFGAVRLLFEVFGLLGAGIVAVIRMMGSLGTLLSTVWGKAKDFVEPFSSSLMDVLRASGVLSISLQDLRNAGLAPFETAVRAIRAAAQWLMDLDIFAWIDNVKNVLTGATTASKSFAEGFSNAGGSVKTSMAPSFEVFGKILDGIVAALRWIGDLAGDAFKKIAKGLQGITFDDVLTAVKGVFEIGLLASIRKSFDGFTSITESFSGALGNLTSGFSTLQKETKADQLIKIAIAIGLLAASLLLISMVDIDKVLPSLGAMGALIGSLMASMATFNKFSTGIDVVKLGVTTLALTMLAGSILMMALALKLISTIPEDKVNSAFGTIIALLVSMNLAMKGFAKIQGKMLSVVFSLGLLAGALILLSVAVLAFGLIPQDVMIQGLIGIASALAIVTLAALALSKIKKDLIIAAAGLSVMALALTQLMVPITALGLLPTGSLVQGLIGITAALGILTVAALAMSKLKKDLILASVGLSAMSVALSLLVPSIVTLGLIPTGTLIQGMIGIAAALGILAVAGLAIGKLKSNLIVAAVGIGAMAVALSLLVPSVVSFGMLPIQVLVQGIIALAAVLAILAGASLLMGAVAPQMIASSVALIAMALALGMLVPTIILLGSTDLTVLAVGILALGVAFAVLGGAALILTPVIPAMLGLGIALSLIGLATVLAGAGLMAFGIGLGLVAAAGAPAIAVIVAAIYAFIQLIPVMVQAFGDAILQFLQILADGAPQFVQVAVDLVLALLDGIVSVFPKIVDAGVQLILSLVKGIANNIGEVTSMAVKAIAEFLRGIADNLQSVVNEALRVIEAFIRGIEEGLPGVVDAAVDLIITFIETCADAIRDGGPRLGRAAGDLAVAIIDGIVGGLWEGVKRVGSAIKNLADRAINSAKEALGINSPSKEFMILGEFTSEGLAVGIEAGEKDVVRAIGHVGSAAVEEMAKTLGTMDTNIGGPVEGPVIVYSTYLDEPPRPEDMPPPPDIPPVNGYGPGRAAGFGYARGFESATTEALTSTMGTLTNDMANGVIFSSAVNLGASLGEGLAEGILSYNDSIRIASEEVSNTALEELRSIMNEITSVLDDADLEWRPEIHPVIVADDLSSLSDVISGGNPRASFLSSVDTDRVQQVATLRNEQTSGEDSGQGSGDTYYNFEQNNYSPEPLDRLTIYRETKDLMRSVKRAQER